MKRKVKEKSESNKFFNTHRKVMKKEREFLEKTLTQLIYQTIKQVKATLGFTEEQKHEIEVSGYHHILQLEDMIPHWKKHNDLTIKELEQHICFWCKHYLKIIRAYDSYREDYRRETNGYSVCESWNEDSGSSSSSLSTPLDSLDTTSSTNLKSETSESQKILKETLQKQELVRNFQKKSKQRLENSPWL